MKPKKESSNFNSFLKKTWINLHKSGDPKVEGERYESFKNVALAYSMFTIGIFSYFNHFINSDRMFILSFAFGAGFLGFAKVHNDSANGLAIENSRRKK